MLYAGSDPQQETQSEEDVATPVLDRPSRAPKVGERYQDRPLTAQTTAGYSRLRPLKRREPEPIRPLRAPADDSQEDVDPGQHPGFEPRPSFEHRPGIEQRPEADAEPQNDEAPNRELASPATRSTRRLPRAAPAHSFSHSESHTESAGLVADDGGPVAEILLHYSVTSEPELGTIYHDLLQQLGQTVRLQVCCPNEQSVEAFSTRWGAAAVGQGRSVHVVNVNRPITVWARDRRISRQTPDGQFAPCFVPTAHATYDPEKQNDLVLTSLLWSTGLVPSVALTSMHLEGGNVVSNRRHVFVGANAFEDNEHRFASEEGLFAELGRLFGRPTIAIQGQDGGVPWIHTDMYVTPIDSKTVLVASPVLGCDLLPDRKTILAVNRGKQVTVEFDTVSADSGRQQRFDDVARQLTDLGYQVIRMPALINVQKDWMVTYNNVIMDYQDGQRVVYMPVYNIPEMDQAAAQTYRALGFEVKPIDVSAIFQLGGAIRCLANVTRRLPFETRFQTREPEGTGRLQVYSVDPSANRAREVRPRREKRPLPNPQRERPEQPAQGYSAAGVAPFGPSSRESAEVAAPARQRPNFESPDHSGRQPVNAGFGPANNME
jgi:N-dimethylarginine dimethylaminohydrolase